ncbi:hypothetical protein ALQ16_201102 [Pseudomonas syringae pv. actinidiae]|nr:hypothetical protein ALQ16_201102 [Pseudomonas syringae pv. actinidiae]
MADQVDALYLRVMLEQVAVQLRQQHLAHVAGTVADAREMNHTVPRQRRRTGQRMHTSCSHQQPTGAVIHLGEMARRPEGEDVHAVAQGNGNAAGQHAPVIQIVA